MKPTLDVLIIIFSTIIILLILIQGRGAGLGSAWGGSGQQYQSRRGVEKWVVRATSLFILIFFIVTLLGLVL
ncbi:preprotein translocase subunit SecG [Candidatus Roizmanbacteria bacterium RIFCSPHIGHO2_01_FULL_39_12b]|uniref:Protein-export membrane protein SecG n=1 Tax=Candidatus Roizmanbacteria bacterium RIFCSPHIGHO2_01_FULL_39_12b TaxID=1802030 RepID=A0A1F7GD94_9BACT|nr:MAG: preprotein translocase subunit SecG [Candidatus Roizmanbacteria bacterium RIFCSPHIGHO2_01_FULL_39_12b]OGK46766.1 MAG: preprotein translocase subunit SecG [Candidatus Roizmanbacteria bacterium RIFCSPLOWO2_01_FULL_39_19]